MDREAPHTPVGFPGLLGIFSPGEPQGVECAAQCCDAIRRGVHREQRSWVLDAHGVTVRSGLGQDFGGDSASAQGAGETAWLNGQSDLNSNHYCACALDAPRGALLRSCVHRLPVDPPRSEGNMRTVTPLERRLSFLGLPAGGIGGGPICFQGALIVIVASWPTYEPYCVSLARTCPIARVPK